MSPTIFRARGFRFHFYSREEIRPHVHVWHADGEAKFWLEPEVELASSHGLDSRCSGLVADLIKEPLDEIRTAWSRHFER